MKSIIDNLAQAKQNEKLANEKKQIHVITDIETFETYKKICKQNGLSMSETTNTLIKAYLESCQE